ncbi:MAG: hypothetical protein QNK03_08190 [Myxococcota bacterium]|nr:hypothetical protein [Myxococcota bacterium]
MLEDLTADSFRPHLNTAFVVRRGEQDDLRAELVEVTPLGTAGAAASARRAPFSLLFRARNAAGLEQRVYRLEHPRLGVLELFLVPVDRDADAVIVEAVFT